MTTVENVTRNGVNTVRTWGSHGGKNFSTTVETKADGKGNVTIRSW